MERDVLNQILHELRELKSDVSELKAGQQKLGAKITGIESDIATLNSRQDETHQIVKAIHHRQDVNDSKLDALKDIQVRHGRALETLSARSIEHESELKRIL